LAYVTSCIEISQVNRLADIVCPAKLFYLLT